MGYIAYRSTENEIIVYWDKPCEATPESIFEIFLDGQMTAETKKTDHTIRGLDEDTEYTVKVAMKGSSVSEEIKCRTLKRKKRLDVTKAPFNAVGDGKTVNTTALQAVFDACTADDTVFFPAGVYLSGALRLHSDTDVYFEKGAVLQGTSDRKDYLPKIKSRFEGYEMECYQSLINCGNLDHSSGPDCFNIMLRGEGEIYGGGKELAKDIAKSEAERLKDYIASLGDKIKEYEKPETIASRARGRLINLSNCKNVWIHGLKLGRGASWNVHFIYSYDVVTDDCEFYSEGIWNGDGWDPDSSEDCTIFNCRFHTEDDSVAIKSGKNPEGNVINRPTRNIRVFDCFTPSSHGICMGSEMSGGIDGVKIWDCDVSETWSGIEIKATKKRGGYVRNIDVRDCAASHIQVHSVGYNDDGIGAEKPPVLENCHFERLTLLGRFFDNNGGKNEWHNCFPIDLQGFDEPGYELNNVTFKDIKIKKAEDPSLGTVNIKYSKNVTLENIEQI
ncbi:MAG: glycoside hydrolase family 28 protein [Lachnospiraceae bacterium]|nr:glycoside hydrolase family 28 protein [Lachnospiraceae bacterium]